MKNEIKEDYVSFELAKLLRDKGFDNASKKWYSVEGSLYYENEFDNNRGFVPQFCCEAPTLALAQKWVYENFGYWVDVHRNSTNFRVGVECMNTGNSIWSNELDYKTPQEALETGLLYTLMELV